MGARQNRFSIAVALAAGLVGCTAQTEPVSEGSTTSALTIDEHTDTLLSGTYAHAGSLIAFEATRTGDRQATLHVEVNGMPLDGTVDNDARTMTWTGHDGALYAEDTAALRELLYAFEAYFGGSIEGLAPHEDFLVRRVMYWSEAPAGLTLGDRVVHANVVPEGAVRTPPPDAVYGEDASTVVGPSPDSEVSYRGGDEDGIWYIRCNRYSWAVHDTGGHCENWESIYGGPNSRSCHGRCGPGCLGGGYTYDCHDHDRCGRVHGGSTNPWDGNCGDEYWEADDDFWWSAIGKCV